MSRSDAYTVLARRYRPQAFEDLVGQGYVARARMRGSNHPRTLEELAQSLKMHRSPV